MARKPLSAAHKRAISNALKGKSRGGKGSSISNKTSRKSMAALTAGHTKQTKAIGKGAVIGGKKKVTAKKIKPNSAAIKAANMKKQLARERAGLTSPASMAAIKANRKGAKRKAPRRG